MSTIVGTNPQRADDYFLETIQIVTATNTVDIKSLMVEISYYEDIFRGSVTGEVLISDSISMIDRLGLCGGEYLNLVFRKTKDEEKTDGVFRRFRIYRVSERILKTQETENYTLHFCSEEFFNSEQLKISKSYNGKKISDIVSEILVKDLQVPQKRTAIQETKGLYDFVIPYKTPFETLHWLCNYALPMSNPGADFLFYETHDSFNFVSLQFLYEQQAENSYMYTARNVGDMEQSSELYRNLVGIKSYTYLDTFDTLYGVTNGAFASQTLTIDPLTRRYYQTDFDYAKDYWLKNTQLNDHAVINNAINRQNKTMNKMYESSYKFLVSNKEQEKAKGISDKPWAVSNDINAEIFVPYRTAQVALSHYTRVRIVISGNPELVVGDTINVELPSSASNKDGSGLNEGNYDVYNTGKYMVSALRHVIKADMKYDTVIEIVKDSMASKLPDWDKPTIYEAVKG